MLKTKIEELDERNNRVESLLQTSETRNKQLNEIIVEKETKWQLFEQEGNALSKRQGDLEKLVRQQKKDIKEKTTEIGKLKESKEQLVKAIEEMQIVIRKYENDLSHSTQTIASLTAASQQTNDKFAKLELEISVKATELDSQRKALETATNDQNELKRYLLEMKNERDEYKRQLGEDASKFSENESTSTNMCDDYILDCACFISFRINFNSVYIYVYVFVYLPPDCVCGTGHDVEKREALLKATNKQLQDSLQRQMAEFTGRESR
jgi:chromosome segregation ATPase